MLWGLLKQNISSLISYYWPPAGGSGVQRWWFFTNEFAKKGWTIDVITVQHPAGTPIDSSFIGQAHPNINVYPLSIWEPGKRLYSTTKSKTSKGLFSYLVRWIRANFSSQMHDSFLSSQQFGWLKSVWRRNPPSG